MKLKSLGGFVLAVTLTGCASSSSQIAPSYVSPIVYDNYNCNQLRQEAQRVASRAAVAAGVQDETATNDAIVTGVAIVLFWPAAFLVSGGNKANAAELARLRGHMDAIEQANIRKQCGIEFKRPKPKPRPDPVKLNDAQT
jgi:hypothetical protein